MAQFITLDRLNCNMEAEDIVSKINALEPVEHPKESYGIVKAKPYLKGKTTNYKTPEEVWNAIEE